MPYLPWPQIHTCIEGVTELEYKRHITTATAAYMSGAAFGGMKDLQPHDLLPAHARPKWLKGTKALRLTLEGKQEKSFLAGLKRGLVSQRLLDLFSEG